MAKYCSSVPSDGIFTGCGPLIATDQSRLPGSCPKGEINCDDGPGGVPRRPGACNPCGSPGTMSCIPGCGKPSMYSACDWEAAFEQVKTDAERERSTAERFRTEAWREIQTSDKRAQNRQCDNTKRLGERVYDIAYWRQAMTGEIRKMDTESSNLKEVLRILDKIKHELKFNKAIIEECLRQREKRLGIECVHDDSERALCKELEILSKIEAMILEYIERGTCQLKKNRAVQHNLEVDVRDKIHAQGIDDRAHQLRNSSCGISFFPGIEKKDKTITDEASYPRYTQNNLRLCVAERQKSEKLRGEIDCFLRGAVNEMWHQYNQTNAAFNARIQESSNAKDRLEEQLQKMTGEIRDIDRTVEMLRKSVASKEAYIKVAQTRLSERMQRRCVELARDRAQMGLQSEIKEVMADMCLAKEKLRQAEALMCRLLKMRASLEQDIANKQNTIQIDSQFCMNLRRKMALEPRLGPFLILPQVECS